MSKQVEAAKYRRYSPSKLAAAVSMVQSGAMSKKKASLTYGIPRTTLIDKLSGKAPLGSNPGKPCVLSAAEEDVLVDYIKLMSSIGYPMKRHELCYEIKKVLDHDSRKTPFPNNLPGKHWYQLFAKRHPELSERSAMALGHQRSIISFDMIKGWFDGLTTYLKQEVSDWESLIKDPRRIFNADESGFPLSVTNGKVLTEKGVRHVYQVCTSNKTQITVLVCFNAFGNYVPPLIVYPGERFRDSGIHEFDDAIYGHTSSGWMDSELFVSFLKHLNDFVNENCIPKPIMLLVDGHSTHMSLDAAQYCFTNNIILYCLLANATHVLQPCDVGFFSPMKAAWKKEVKTWQLENLGQALTKKQFPGVFKKAWLKVAKLENAVHGFKKCGLFPLNPANIDVSKLNPSKAITLTPATENASSVPNETNTPADTSNLPSSSSQSTQPIAETSTSENSSSSTTVTDSSNQSTTLSADKILSNSTQAQMEPATNEILTLTKETSGVSYVAQTREEYVSESFSLLSVPEVKKKRPSNTLRQKLPKALSGKDALRMLKEKEEAKKAEEIAKQKRKEEREAKKAKKLEEKEQKRVQREENQRKRKQEKLFKQALSQAKKRKGRESSSSGSEADDLNLNDSDDDYNEDLIYPGCNSDEGSQDEWIICTACRRRWHITCTGDAVLFEIPASQIENYPFHCEFCL